MGRQVRQAVPHLSLEEVKQRMKREPRFWVRQRWWIIYHAQIAPGNTREIAKQTGVSERTVRRVISSYNRLGPATMETPGTGGRRHEYLTAEQEQVFLAPFFARAKHGELTTVRHIRQALEAEVNHAIGLSTVYDLLHRHGWRKLVPRPLHPKANPEEQAAFLKNFPAIVQASVATRDPSDQRPVLLMAQDEGRFGCISVPRRA